MKETESRYFVYKMVVDNGGAPCVMDKLLSLAICKPRIRKGAKEGDYVFGIGGTEYEERLIYIAEVTEKLQGVSYYRKRKYSKRPDCIYRCKSGKAMLKKQAKYHNKNDQLEKDVGSQFENAFVLLSGNFRYLGKKGTNDYKKKFPLLKKLVEGLTQGHRCKYSPELHDELEKLKDEIWANSDAGGHPSDKDCSLPCNGNSASAIC